MVHIRTTKANMRGREVSFVSSLEVELENVLLFTKRWTVKHRWMHRRLKKLLSVADVLQAISLKGFKVLKCKLVMQKVVS